MPLAREVMRWLFTGKGMLSYSPSIVAASVKVLESSATPDMQSRSRQAASRTARSANSRRRPVSAPAHGRCGPCRAVMSRPGRTNPARCRRSTRVICRTRPTGAPSSAGCGSRDDVRRARAEAVVREESLPGGHVQTDDELLDYARGNGSACYHASCTCMMGLHPTSVVDNELRVHGMDGLRVIDASVMPAVTSTNTNAPTIMIAEKGAAMIKGAARQRMAA